MFILIINEVTGGLSWSPDLVRCCDVGPQTDVIVNTISDTMNLNQGAVSKAILLAAGPSLQQAVNSEAGVAKLPSGKVVVTDGYNLMCRKVFHAVCPFWDDGAGQAEAVSESIESLGAKLTA